MSEFRDTELIDFLQKVNDQADYTGKCIMRESDTGRGWRLHEDSTGDAVQDVREAISDYMYKYYQRIICDMSFEEILRIHRFSNSNHILLRGELGKFFNTTYKARKNKLSDGEFTTISKAVGW